MLFDSMDLVYAPTTHSRRYRGVDILLKYVKKRPLARSLSLLGKKISAQKFHSQGYRVKNIF